MTRDSMRPRRALALSIALAVGAAILGVVPTPAGAATQTRTFAYTGGPQGFAVPPGVTAITVNAAGAQGGSGGGLGGRSTATIPVTAGETLQVNVGGRGGDIVPGNQTGFPSEAFVAAGGFNGGGRSIAGTFFSGGGGGGASDVRQGGTDLGHRVVVAGGGGGVGGDVSGARGSNGGAGGGVNGEGGGDGHAAAQSGSAPGRGGGGGTQTQGGAGGSGGTFNGGTAGVLGNGGIGAQMGGFTTNGGSGGGGGGGLFGGGGGGAGVNRASGGGGGGGSGLVPVGGTTVQGAGSQGPGSVVLTYELPTVLVVAGAAFYIDGTSDRTGPFGAPVSLFATRAEPGFSYKLVSGRGTGQQPCSTDIMPINDALRFANAEGVIARTGGTLNRPSGQWQICFLAEGQVVTGAVTYTVTG